MTISASVASALVYTAVLVTVALSAVAISSACPIAGRQIEARVATRIRTARSFFFIMCTSPIPTSAGIPAETYYKTSYEQNALSRAILSPRYHCIKVILPQYSPDYNTIFTKSYKSYIDIFTPPGSSGSKKEIITVSPDRVTVIISLNSIIQRRFRTADRRRPIRFPTAGLRGGGGGRSRRS